MEEKQEKEKDLIKIRMVEEIDSISISIWKYSKRVKEDTDKEDMKSCYRY